MTQAVIKKRGGRPNNRAHILDTASSLFVRFGFRDVSVDKISEAAGVTKQTLYYHFRNKDQIVIEALDDCLENISLSLAASVRARSAPRDRLKAIFDWYTDWFSQPDFTGCVFMRAALEYNGQNSAINERVTLHKQTLRGALKSLIEDAGVPKNRSDSVARAFASLLDGAVVSVMVLGEKDAACTAWKGALTVLSNQIPST
ncbi:TetR family transcriptional regulator [Gluconacetobacter sacchari DSM 12717]|uniref:TetR/AcrR family transcriptional regulator n=2 Tax=Gluconacetobacter sacchari TaxID=92759 RepID=A0A7W4ID54_9PROT|nr:TetR/AcrR family transcriptional regulator [Gluconacetobacter sacchari]MBB2160640.1 TetR/AcrR family transcriptional regulator [Gluconacetobacter sacchari]GBQ20958.1 TetR family transcriptional regulator [Gluconacetobacter sacchari DSM 12717]